ncbi:MAG: hypothetical protein ACRD33_06435, partial [Candidatus Acidiferrales bacterium]
GNAFSKYASSSRAGRSSSIITALIAINFTFVYFARQYTHSPPQAPNSLCSSIAFHFREPPASLLL